VTSLLHPRARPLPALVSTLALAPYWALFRMPVPGARGVELDSEESRRIHDEADFMRRLGKWDRALKPTLKLHAAYPESPVYLPRLGEIYDHLGRFAVESAVWEQFLDRSPTPIEGCPQAGQAYEKQGLSKQAIATFERCLGFQPGNPDSIFYLAHALEPRNELFGRPLFTETPGERARDPRAWYLLAASYGAVYGILSDNGRRLYVADGVNYRKYRFELGAPSSEGREPSGSDQREQDGRIRDAILAINRFYRFGEVGKP